MSSPLCAWSQRATGVAFALALALTSALAQSGPHTPAAGTPERNAIFDAMHSLGDIHDRVFVARYLKVLGDWAWVTADPQSRDNTQHYETESALLQRTGQKWRVVDQPCGEADCDHNKELARIRKRFPDAPAAIFPAQ
ncbi:MAG: hypothetical protein ACLPKB_28205 [Xanthobacteraceae bacterium]